MKKATLLDRAKKMERRTRRVYGREEIELAHAWAVRDITNSQVARAITLKGGVASSGKLYPFLALALREWFTRPGIRR